jgi:hypothetical protein
MLCAQCNSLPAAALRRGPAVSAGAAWRSNRPGVCFCERCGALLIPSGDTDALLDKLSQLARFGLVGDPKPILDRSEEPD